jgi:lipopolysaccharide/colanic/teichoic acid biosynthesis glycosyltransferase
MTVAFQASSHRAQPPGQRLWNACLAAAASQQFQLLGALALGIIVPAAITFFYGSTGLGIKPVVNTALAGGSATIVGALIMSRLGAYPKVRRSSLIVVDFALVFAAAALSCQWLEIDFSSELLAMDFLLVACWFWVVLDLTRQSFPPQILLVGAAAGSEPVNDPYLVMPDLESVVRDARNFNWVVARSASETPTGVSGVVADLRSGLPQNWEQFLARCALMGLPIYNSKDFAESITGRVKIEALSENNLSSLLAALNYVRVKGALDVAVAVLVAPFAICFGLLVAIAIKLDDGGPVFYCQERMGFRRKPFKVVKFRTMRTETGATCLFTAEADARITRLGRYLRKFRIDELPQMINVLRGEMSWIGPRPEAMPLSRWYEDEIPFYVYRHLVRPGITGWAQVNQGNVAEIEAVTTKLHYDFYYLKHFSPWLDLIIAAKTIRIIATGYGSR